MPDDGSQSIDDARDARRYRWLREHAGTVKANPLVYLVEDELDRYVDAEIEEAARAK